MSNNRQDQVSVREVLVLLIFSQASTGNLLQGPVRQAQILRMYSRNLSRSFLWEATKKAVHKAVHLHKMHQPVKLKARMSLLILILTFWRLFRGHRKLLHSLGHRNVVLVMGRK